MILNEAVGTSFLGLSHFKTDYLAIKSLQCLIFTNGTEEAFPSICLGRVDPPVSPIQFLAL